jgi:hypothetical protein
METIFSIHQILHYKNHVIRAEKRSLFYTMEYSLIIDNVKQDQINGLYGILILHGMLKDNGHQKPVKVMVKQTVFTSKFYCKIDGEIYKMNKYKLDEV